MTRPTKLEASLSDENYSISQSPISRRSSASSHTVIVSPEDLIPPEVINAQYSIGVMQGSIQALEDILDKMQSNTLDLGMGDAQVQKEFEEIRERLRNQQKVQSDGIEEINLILNDILENKVVAKIQEQVEREVEAEVDKLVDQQVKACLKELIPVKLQQKVKDKRAELDRVRLELHNSESRRANAQLTHGNHDEAVIVNTVLLPDGTVSALFPKTLKDLFTLDAKATKSLLEEQKISTSAKHDVNLNRVLKHLNVQYQMVRDDQGRSRPMGVEVTN